MATTFNPVRFGGNDPRPSNETDRRQLLAESIAPSETSSIYTATDGDRTPRAASPARSTNTQTHIPSHNHTRHQSLASTPSQTQQKSYRGFPSEAAYLAALQQWADSKKYIEPMETGLKGFYGETTMEEYASRPRAFGELGLRAKWRKRKESKAEAKKGSGSGSERLGEEQEVGDGGRMGRRATVT